MPCLPLTQWPHPELGRRRGERMPSWESLHQHPVKTTILGSHGNTVQAGATEDIRSMIVLSKRLRDDVMS